MFGDGWLIGLAIGLAVIDACCFAAAAVWQQRAVRRTVLAGAEGAETAAEPDPKRHQLSLRGLVTLIRNPGWLFGIGLMGLGVVLHMIALVLAPVSVIQPIGVLGVPLAVLLAARLARRRPSRSLILPIVICVAGIAGFVVMISGRAVHDATAPLIALLVAEAVVLIVIAASGVIARLLHGWPRCVLNAVGGAIAVGMVSALVRAIAAQIDGDPARLLEPGTLALIAMALVNAAAGGWLVQQAYASGPADVVLACLTVIDPMIAVVVGLGLLGEGAALTAGGLLGMIIFAGVAVAGVLALARSHPQLNGQAGAARNQGRPDRAVPDRDVSHRPVATAASPSGPDRRPAELLELDA